MYGMPRPLTKSPPIQFRLSLERYAQIEKAASALGVSVSQYVASKLEGAVVKGG